MTNGFNPLNDKQRNIFNDLIKELTTDQAIWLHGYFEGRLSGFSGKAASTAATSAPAVVELAKLTILYGSETGHSHELAEKLAEKAANKNIAATVFNMYDYNTKKLIDEENIAIIVSTHGEGDPPDMAGDFHKFITGKRAPKLEKMNFSVLALGDKSYKHFCKTGEDIDSAIRNLGAFRVTPLVKCDVDYEVSAEIWMNNVLLNLASAVQTVASEVKTDKPAATHSKKNPFMATVLEKVKITGRDSDKEVYHLELSLEESGLTYLPGDSVGIFAVNPESLVEQILQKTGFDPEYVVTLENGEMNIREALSHHLEITVLTFDTVKKYYEITKLPELEKLLNDDKLLDGYLYGHDLLDILEDYPFDWNPNKLVDVLRQLPPRLYSISSSQDNVGDEVHATVSIVRYERKNRLRNGACSSHLADNIEIDDQVPVYIEKNPSFKLPLNGSKLIMVGAGTGIAPYRAFLQQRETENKTGGAWLFFGDRRFQSDFLYQVEWQKWLKSNHLEKMDVAFSRDQEEKIYVQHKLLENQEEIFRWLEDGAHLYLCGDMKSMAKDVNKTLLEIVKTQGGVSIEKAGEYVKKLKREKRFQQDVY